MPRRKTSLATSHADGITFDLLPNNCIYAEIPMQSISVPELALWRSAKFPHTLIDVRRKLKRKEDGVAIANGQWLDPALWLEWKDTVPATHPVIIYCAHGHELSQGLAATLRAMGIDARYLLGGIEAWRATGQSVESINVHDQRAGIS